MLAADGTGDGLEEGGKSGRRRICSVRTCFFPGFTVHHMTEIIRWHGRFGPADFHVATADSLACLQ